MPILPLLIVYYSTYGAKACHDLTPPLKTIPFQDT